MTPFGYNFYKGEVIAVLGSKRQIQMVRQLNLYPSFFFVANFDAITAGFSSDEQPRQSSRRTRLIGLLEPPNQQRLDPGSGSLHAHKQRDLPQAAILGP